jgi:hypothetical protein
MLMNGMRLVYLVCAIAILAIGAIVFAATQDDMPTKASESSWETITEVGASFGHNDHVQVFRLQDGAQICYIVATTGYESTIDCIE